MKRKRIKTKRVTAESQALKKIREMFELSQSQLAERLNISKTSVNHYENGWSAISEAYIDSFLETLDYPRHDWELIVDPNNSNANMRSNCLKLIEQVDNEKLNAIHNLLISFIT